MVFFPFQIVIPASVNLSSINWQKMIHRPFLFLHNFKALKEKVMKLASWSLRTKRCSLLHSLTFRVVCENAFENVVLLWNFFFFYFFFDANWRITINYFRRQQQPRHSFVSRCSLPWMIMIQHFFFRSAWMFHVIFCGIFCDDDDLVNVNLVMKYDWFS